MGVQIIVDLESLLIFVELIWLLKSVYLAGTILCFNLFSSSCAYTFLRAGQRWKCIGFPFRIGPKEVITDGGCDS
jgi:hypothetical protein